MKNNKFIILIVLLCTFFIAACSNNKTITDSEKFKKEYESINGKVNETSGKKYRNISISKDNPMVYSTAEEIVDKMNQKESFVVYFGFKECPWCRSVIEQLMKVAKDKKVEKIYYVDVTGIRDVKELNDEGEIITKDEGTEAYQLLIEKMENVLEEYTLTKDEEKIEVGEKRIYAPNVVAVSKGKAIQLETGISEELKDPYDELTDSIKNYSYKQYKCLLDCLEEESTTCQKNMC